MNKIVNIEPLVTVDPREASLDKQTASLVESIRNSLSAQTEMFCRILDGSPNPSIVLAELLEDTGNRYIDFSEAVSAAAKRGDAKPKSKGAPAR
jgi:hypothetical protein